jgi:hypothetical protein
MSEWKLLHSGDPDAGRQAHIKAPPANQQPPMLSLMHDGFCEGPCPQLHTRTSSIEDAPDASHRIACNALQHSTSPKYDESLETRPIVLTALP